MIENLPMIRKKYVTLYMNCFSIGTEDVETVHEILKNSNRQQSNRFDDEDVTIFNEILNDESLTKTQQTKSFDQFQTIVKV